MLAAAATASAGPVTLTLNNGGTDVMAGVYVGPYNFTSSSGSLQLICDDYVDEVYPGESWTATTSTLSPLASGLKFTGSNGTLTQYEEAAWLAQQIFALGPANSSNDAQIGYLQYALWDIFTCGPTGLSSATCASAGFTGTNFAGVTTAFDNAMNDYSTGNYSDVVIYTPTGTPTPAGDGPPQEYIGIISTPEPGSLLLIGAGLFSLAAFRRRLSY